MDDSYPATNSMHKIPAINTATIRPRRKYTKRRLSPSSASHTPQKRRAFEPQSQKLNRMHQELTSNMVSIDLTSPNAHESSTTIQLPSPIASTSDAIPAQLAVEPQSENQNLSSAGVSTSLQKAFISQMASIGIDFTTRQSFENTILKRLPPPIASTFDATEQQPATDVQPLNRKQQASTFNMAKVNIDPITTKSHQSATTHQLSSPIASTSHAIPEERKNVVAKKYKSTVSISNIELISVLTVLLHFC